MFRLSLDHFWDTETAVENCLGKTQKRAHKITNRCTFTGPHYGAFTSQPTSMMQVIVDNWKKIHKWDSAFLRIADYIITLMCECDIWKYYDGYRSSSGRITLKSAFQNMWVSAIIDPPMTSFHCSHQSWIMVGQASRSTGRASNQAWCVQKYPVLGFW